MSSIYRVNIMDFGAVNMASASVAKAQSSVEMKAATAVTKIAMESANVEAKAIHDMMPQVSPPGLGGHIDTKA